MAVPNTTSGPTPGLSPEEVVADRYVVRRRLGAGGMGEAWLAEDRVLHRKLVLKRLTGALPADASRAGQLLSEARRSSAIESPHIAQVYDVCSHSGEWILAMEYVPGRDLRTVLAAPIDAERFFSLAVQIAQAIEAAHSSGILHCDIKPENIMVTEQGFVKVLDFGLARIVAVPGSGETVSLASGTAAFAGTPGYMAPEVLRENAPTEQSDIFALGVVLYELAGGRAPFKGKTTADSVLLTLTVEPAPLDLKAHGLPGDLQRVLSKAISKQPERRYATVRDLLVDLKSLQHQSLAGASFVTTTGTFKGKLRPFLLLPAVVLVLFVAIAVTFMRVREHRANAPAAPGAAQAPAAQAPAAQAPAVPAARLLAVLPFHVLGASGSSPDTGMSAYSEGLREAITTSLAGVASAAHIEVLAASEVRAHSLTTPEEAHKELGADLVIDGSYQQIGNRVQILYELSDTSGKILNSGTLIETLKDPFALESHVTAGVLEMLRLAPQSATPAQFGTENPAAYDAWLRGIGYLRDFQIADNLRNAVASFTAATKADPGFAAAFAGLGEAQWASYKADANSAHIAPARAACARAMQLNAGIAAAQICQATIDDGTGKVAQAQAEYQKALDLDPQSDTALNGLARTSEEREMPGQAQHVYEQAIQARPYYWANYYALANFLVRRANYTRAAEVLQDAVQRFPENSFLARRLGVVCFLEGKLDQASAVLEKAIAQRPEAMAYMDLGQVDLHQRKFADAVTSLEAAARMRPTSSSIEADLGDAYAWSGAPPARAQASYRRALDLSTASLEVNPLDLDALMIAAYASAALGRQQDALRYLDSALTHAPEDAEVNYYAARVSARLGQTAAARNWAQKAIAHGYSQADIATAPDLAGLLSSR